MPNIIPAYPFDPTGQLASNLVDGEQQILTAANSIDFKFIVPKFAPYFSDSLVITITDLLGDTRTLDEGIDYICTHWFIAASRACAKQVFGSVSILDLTLAGVLTLKYQTLGGIWTIDSSEIAAMLSDELHNPRITAWDEVTDKPIAFPTIDHEWNLVDMVGMSPVVDSINLVRDAIIQKINNTVDIAGLYDQIAQINTALTGLQPKLGYVPYNETNPAKYQTDVQVASAISQIQGANVTAQSIGLGNVNNTADIDKPVSTAQAAADAVVLSTAEQFATAAANAALGAVVTKFNTRQGDVTLNSADVITALGFTPGVAGVLPLMTLGAIGSLGSAGTTWVQNINIGSVYSGYSVSGGIGYMAVGSWRCLLDFSGANDGGGTAYLYQRIA